MARHPVLFTKTNGNHLTGTSFGNLLLLLFLLNINVDLFSFQKTKALQLQRLRCEMLVDPVGIDVRKPRLSWEITGGERDLQQSAFQILVASSQERLSKDEGDLWNSGKVMSDQSIHVEYNGAPLSSRMACFWKVKVWTTQGDSPWSQPASWSMGLYANDWQAKWIGLDRAFSWDSADHTFSRLSARYFRKEFSAQKQIKRAVAYIVGLGLYELYINGQRVGDQVLAPVPTDYTQSVKYNSFDITAILKQGVNAVGTTLGNGRYFTMRQAYKPYKIHTFGYPKMLMQLEIEFNDGTRQTIITDETWKVTSDGPIRTNNEYDGEEYDAAKELTGWNTTPFDDSKWLSAELVQEPGGKVQAQVNENMKVMETIKPIAIRELRTGTFILDMGQNMVGWLKIRVNGKRGDRVTLRFGETLQSNGELFTRNLRDARVTDVYTLKGGGEERWEPSFVYHGFRYVEITGYPGTPAVTDFEGRVVYDAMETTGSFETSNNTINRIYKNAYWGIRGNYKGMPVDCPQRNERQPWLGDRATGSYGESFVFDHARLYAKWLDDIEQSQTAEGRIPDVAPNFWFYYKDNMTWPGTYLMAANMLYNQFGDRRPIEKHYASMKQWLVFMQAKYMDDYIVSKDSYGDWCVPPESEELIHSQDPSRKTDGAVIATAYYYHMLELMQRFARLLNKPKEEKAFAELGGQIRTAFNKKFLNDQTAQYSNGTVTANILPLSFGMVPELLRAKVFNNIVDKIINENGGHLSTGVIGTQWLMRGLTNGGRPDIAYKIAGNSDYPSWGYMVERGATTIWELWNGDTADPAMNSHNHVMLLGDLIVWYYENLAGIKTAAGHPAFRQIDMRPVFVNDLDHVSASYHSMHGMIKSDWRKNGRKLTWSITVPGNTKAIVHIPASSEKQVLENGKKIPSVKGVRFLRMENDRAVFEVGSGEYTFTSTL
jgi:alpha-L-rhamnosidase